MAFEKAKTYLKLRGSNRLRLSSGKLRQDWHNLGVALFKSYLTATKLSFLSLALSYVRTHVQKNNC
jgi:hypothetical protein